MAKFDMGEFAKTLAQPVSESGTGREQIEYIDVDLLDSDPGNFYALRDLDDLAANIATIGLQQPIRVRAGEGGHVVIVSGHRRAAAIRKLVAEGRTDLREVPCIRELDDASPALRELRLIYANSSTRDLTAAELSHQAEKVRELLYQLQEEGFEFPGRMRDHVAEACKSAGASWRGWRRFRRDWPRATATHGRLGRCQRTLRTRWPACPRRFRSVSRGFARRKRQRQTLSARWESGWGLIATATTQQLFDAQTPGPVPIRTSSFAMI